MECRFKEGDLVVRAGGPPSKRSCEVVKITDIEFEVIQLRRGSPYGDRREIERYSLTVEDSKGVRTGIRENSKWFITPSTSQLENSGFKSKKVKPAKVMQIVKEQQVKVNGKSRKITIVVAIADDQVRAGYSVKLPSCKKNPEMAVKIATGRAMSDRTNLVDMEVGEGMDKKFILYAIAEHLIKRIECGSLVIKGIR